MGDGGGGGQGGGECGHGATWCMVEGWLKDWSQGSEVFYLQLEVRSVYLDMS